MRFLILISLGIMAAVVIFLPGFSRISELKAEKIRLEKEIIRVRQMNKKLIRETERLKTDPTYIEEIARSKLNMAKEGEWVYKVKGEYLIED